MDLLHRLVDQRFAEYLLNECQCVILVFSTLCLLLWLLLIFHLHVLLSKGLLLSIDFFLNSSAPLFRLENDLI